MLSVENLSFSYGERTLFKNLSFNVEPGKSILLTGGNGTGKSTVLKLIHKELAIQHGSITVFSKPVEYFNLTELEQVAPLVNQEPVIASNQSVIDNILGLEEPNIFQLSYLFSLRKNTHNKILPIYQELAKKVGLNACGTDKAGNLSYGQQRLLSLIRALWPTKTMTNKLLLLDEPLAGISKSNCVKVLATVKQYKENGWGVVMVEHLPIAKDDATKIVNIEDFRPDDSV